MSDERFYFDSDDDGHDYLVPLKQRDEFVKMLYECCRHPFGSDELYAALDVFEEKFGDMRIGQAIRFYSFTDPRE